MVINARHPEATIDDITFHQFFGIYDGSLVAVFYGGQYRDNFPSNEILKEIDGFIFSWTNGYPILVWNNGILFELEQAYEQKLLTKENLITIHSLLKVGICYDLQDAYDQSLRTIEDIKHMAHFVSGGAIYKDDSEELIKIDFKPQMEKPDIADLDLPLIHDMKKAFYEKIDKN